MLILGGTGFIGPHFVHAALARGHDVAVFSRGEADADLPPDVEQLTGHRDNDLSSLDGRDWDAIVDLATYVPRWVRTLGERLSGRVGHYTFISTIDTYKRPSANISTDEASDVLEFRGTVDPYAVDGQFTAIDPALLGEDAYGSLKILCEREGERQFPGTLVVRPGYMVGPGDPQERFTYWVARIERGGDVLAPGDPLQPVQFIDVRDVADWVIRMAESAEPGVYNALGPPGSMTMCELLGGIRGHFAAEMKATWVPIPWTGRQDIVDSASLEWSIWRFSRDDAINSNKAYAKGLRCRPLRATVEETLAWYRALPAERRATVLTGTKRNDNGAWQPVRTSWADIHQRERTIIANWNTQKRRAARPLFVSPSP